MSISLYSSLRLIPKSNALYVSALPSSAPVQGKITFGGITLAQSLWAALQAFPDTIPVSLHSYFIAPGDPKSCTQYLVKTLRNGKGHIHAHIEASQGPRVIATSTVLLSRENDKHIHPERIELPHVCEFNEASELVKTHPLLSESRVKMLENNFRAGSLEYRFPDGFFNPSDRMLTQERGNTNRKELLDYYVRARHITNQDDINEKTTAGTDLDKFAYIVLTYFSDSYFLLSLPWFKKRAMYSHTFSTSLDHSLHFFSKPKISDFCLLRASLIESDTRNRHLLQGKYYDYQGRPVASVQQQGLVTFPALNKELIKPRL